jgi:hypothetical protein
MCQISCIVMHELHKLPLPYAGYFEATRSNDAIELIKLNPRALVLAYVIAARANWRGGFNHQGCNFGEACLGDYENYGMSEREYRTAKDHLAKNGFATFKSTTKGTVAKLTDTRLFKINPPTGGGPGTDQRQTSDGLTTTNLKLKAVKLESNNPLVLPKVTLKTMREAVE